jgi:hypothetical protein
MNESHNISGQHLLCVCVGGGGLYSIKTPSIHIRYSSYDYPKKEHYAHTKEIRFFIFILLFLCVWPIEQ